MDLELLDLYDRYYARQVVVDNAVNRRSRKLLQVIKKLKGEFDVIRSRERDREEECEGLRVKCEDAITEFKKNPAVVALREKIYVLSAEVNEHKLNLDRMMNFIYIEDDEDLAFLPKEPSPGFGIGSPSVSVNTKPLKANEKPEIQPIEVIADSEGIPKPDLFVVYPGSVAARIKDRKCKTRGGSSRPPVKRKLASGSSSTCATRAKASSSKDDAPFLTVSEDEDGLPNVLELKDATSYLYDRYYARQVVVDNAVNRRSRELLQVIKKLRGEFDVIRSRERDREEECEGLRVKCEDAITEFKKNPVVVALREKIYVLSAEVNEHKLNLDRMMLLKCLSERRLRSLNRI
nr:hypothetical protein [Tanacetum cinerariifolium]